ncbi:PH0542 domain-containing protein [Palaeococcus ferrophilus]|uniref:PH0542 domain-containing protein n=1 Tax=Palaeococcus ferrophilus TaxID=83868 RepID=UPI00064E3631|nr:PH0542 domain-containing protein [Palaeococcus ferrophilus]
MEEEEFDMREALATGEDLDKVLAYALIHEEYLRELISYLDDDLWTVAKNALSILLQIAKDQPELYEPMLSKMMVMVRKSESVPLTQEIARAFGQVAKARPELVKRVMPVLFASYRIGDIKVRVNMVYVIEEIARSNPYLLRDLMTDIKLLITSKDAEDRLTALNLVTALGENNFAYVRPFLHYLLGLLNDENEVVRASAVESLVILAEKNEKFRKLVLSKLEDINDTSELVNRAVKDGMVRLAIKEGV